MNRNQRKTLAFHRTKMTNRPIPPVRAATGAAGTLGIKKASPPGSGERRLKGRHNGFGRLRTIEIDVGHWEPDTQPPNMPHLVTVSSLGCFLDKVLEDQQSTSPLQFLS